MAVILVETKKNTPVKNIASATAFPKPFISQLPEIAELITHPTVAKPMPIAKSISAVLAAAAAAAPNPTDAPPVKPAIT